MIFENFIGNLYLILNFFIQKLALQLLVRQIIDHVLILQEFGPKVKSFINLKSNHNFRRNLIVHTYYMTDCYI